MNASGTLNSGYLTTSSNPNEPNSMSGTNHLVSPPIAIPLGNAPEDTLLIRPNFKQKFKPAAVQIILRQVLKEKLMGRTYQEDECTGLTQEIAEEVRLKLKELNLDRYKYVVQVVLGEYRGSGVKMGSRCFWDPDTDNLAQELFTNDSLFCVVAAYGVFFY